MTSQVGPAQEQGHGWLRGVPTGALGLIMTVGGRGPRRPGVFPPLAPCCDVPMLLNRSGTPGFWPEPCDGPFIPVPRTSPRPWLLGGRGLLRISLRVDVEDEGVRFGDWLVSLVPAEFGDAVPSLESFFLVDLLESLPPALESWKRVSLSSDEAPSSF